MQTTLCPLLSPTFSLNGVVSVPRHRLKSISQRRSFSLSCSLEDNNDEIGQELEFPNPFEKKKVMTALQKHVAFFDRNNDGVIYPWETTQGFMALGYNPILSAIFSIAANAGLSLSTRPWRLIDPLLPIEIKNIKLGKHGSDTCVYDKEGRFVNDKFEDIFKKYAETDPESLTHDELMEMIEKNRKPCDFWGWLAAYAEWEGLWYLCRNKQDKLEKDTIRACYDGSLFEQIEADRKQNNLN